MKYGNSPYKRVGKSGEMNKMKKIIIALCLLMLFFNTPVIAEENINQMMANTHFSTELESDNILNNTIGLKFISVLTNYTGFALNESYYYSEHKFLGLHLKYWVTIEGIKIAIKNSTDKVLVIKCGESNLSIGSFSGIPFLDGMKYKDAGNPSVTPDILVPPNQTVEKNFYISNVYFAGSTWAINGVPIKKDGSTKATLTLKLILGNDQNTQYYSVTSPSIVIKN